MNNFIWTLKKLFSSMVGIVIIAIILSIILKIELNLLIKFIISSFMIVIGVSFYLIGYDMSYPKISDKISLKLIKRKNIFYILGLVLLLGLIITFFEPEILRVSNFNNNLLIILAFSINFFFSLSIYRVITKGNFKYYLIISYIIVFLLMTITDFKIIPFAFDRLALCTGAITSPFLLTMGRSFSKKSYIIKKEHTSFGILGLSSLGPMIIFLILGIFFKLDLNKFNLSLSTFNYLLYICVSMIPIIIIYLIFINFNIKKYKKDIIKVFKGLSFVFLGIILFILGANFGYLKFASVLGEKIIQYNFNLTIIISLILGFLITKVEPSFNFLMNYINEVTNGGIKEKFLSLFLSLGVSLSFIVSIYIVSYNLNIMIFLIPSFFLAVLLAFFVPNRFLAIAFDSLGAVIGTISSSFFIPFLVGIANVFKTNYLYNTFGLLAFIGIIPVIFLEIAGFIYDKEEYLYNYNNLDDRIVDYD